MGVNLSGRNFLKLLDFTPEEIRYLLELSADLKAKKHAHDRTATSRARTSSCSSRRPPRAPAAPLRWAAWTSAWA